MNERRLVAIVDDEKAVCRATMGELAASLAHEVKQPISAAMTDARTCSRWLTRDLPDLAEAQTAASRVVNDVARASEIIGRVSQDQDASR